jgi:hypothetical protein
MLWICGCAYLRRRVDIVDDDDDDDDDEAHFK